MIQREGFFVQSEENAKVQRLSEGGELQATAFVRVPVLDPRARSSQLYDFRTISRVEAENDFKSSYVDINWT